MTVAQRREEIRLSVGTLNDETLYGMIRFWDWLSEGGGMMLLQGYVMCFLYYFYFKHHFSAIWREWCDLYTQLSTFFRQIGDEGFFFSIFSGCWREWWSRLRFQSLQSKQWALDHQLASFGRWRNQARTIMMVARGLDFVQEIVKNHAEEIRVPVDGTLVVPWLVGETLF